ncbi:MAG: tryptophan-rich sensory protein, partial [Edaphobacter sp.]
MTTSISTPKPLLSKRMRPWQALAAFLVVCYAVAAIGSLSAVHSIPTWYAALNKPSFNPPNWI